MTSVYLVGNGISRKGFDLGSLTGPIVGCNEAYKEFPGFSLMISIDGMATLDIKKNWGGAHAYKQNDHFVVNEVTYKLPKLPKGFGFDSGRLAIVAAMKLYNPSSIYLIGYDFGGPRLYTTKVSKRAPKYEDVWNYLFGLYSSTKFYYVGSTDLDINCSKLTYGELV